MLKRHARAFVIFFLAGSALAASNLKQNADLEAGRRAYEASEYAKAIEAFQAAAAKDPANGEIHFLLARTYLELQEQESAIKSAERAVSLEPRNSVYHEWLGKAYGEKADHAGWFSAMSLAKKAHKEFETAVQMDERNFSARQALVEFDCSAPGMLGGGEDKAQPHIRELAAMDEAEGHYAAGNCRRQKKDFAVADQEFTKALESHPKSAALIFDIGDYALKRSQPERMLAVAEEGERVAPDDPRGKFYRAVAFVLRKEKPEEADRLLQEYLRVAPKRSGYPSAARLHVWLGRLYESQNRAEDAEREFDAASRIDSKDKFVQEAVKRAKKY